ncbi:MAG TPA: hypothetical protein VF377_17025 [Acidimicrobiia bacterium]|jgi:hypothetical protein
MSTGLEIRGGAGPFEAAAVAAVVQHVLETERALRQRPPAGSNTPPAWVRAALPRNPEDPIEWVFPDHRGDPL